MKNILSLIAMMLLPVFVASCGTGYARPDRCVCDPLYTEDAVEEPAKEIKKVIEEAVKEEKKEFTIDFEKLAQQSLFEFNSDKISENNYSGLNVVAKFLNENKNVSIKIEGHTDNIGTQEYNQDLSERRAKSVGKYLADKGVEQERITTEGFGFSKPIASNDTAEGRAKNRRTEMKFTVNDVPDQQANKK